MPTHTDAPAIHLPYLTQEGARAPNLIWENFPHSRLTQQGAIDREIDIEGWCYISLDPEIEGLEQMTQSLVVHPSTSWIAYTPTGATPALDVHENCGEMTPGDDWQLVEVPGDLSYLEIRDISPCTTPFLENYFQDLQGQSFGVLSDSIRLKRILTELEAYENKYSNDEDTLMIQQDSLSGSFILQLSMHSSISIEYPFWDI